MRVTAPPHLAACSRRNFSLDAHLCFYGTLGVILRQLAAPQWSNPRAYVSETRMTLISSSVRGPQSTARSLKFSRIQIVHIKGSSFAT